MLRIAIAAAGLAALAAAQLPAQAAEGRYCLIQAMSGAKNCSYASKAACEKQKGAPADFCELYNGTTTGSGAKKK